MAVNSFSSATSQKVFLHDYQIPRKIKVKGLKSIFFRKQREVSRVRPSLKNANLPEPIWKLFVNQFSGFLGHSLATFCLFCHDWIMPLALYTLQQIPTSSPNQVFNDVCSLSKYCCSAGDKVNFVLWTGKSLACCMYVNRPVKE